MFLEHMQRHMNFLKEKIFFLREKLVITLRILEKKIKKNLN
jgi:hypothetical protein